jgi:large repetitive protein
MLDASGGTGSTTWSLSSGRLPSGVGLDASGTISGTPAELGTFNMTVSAADVNWPGNTTTGSLTLTVNPLPLVITTTGLPAGSVGQPYQATLTASGGTGLTSWSVSSGTLPKGFALGANGVLSATPTAVGTFTFTVQASDAGWAGNTATQTLSVVVGVREIVLYASDATTVAGTWSLVADATAAGGSRLNNPDKGAAKLTSPLASPANYFEVTFQAEAGVAYHLWMRGKAEKNSWANDSVMVQFSGSADAAGTPQARIGTTSSFDLNLEDCSGCGVAGWGWQDNGYGANVFGPDVYFAQSGQQTIRVQVREDGFGIDQIVLSADKYRTAAPGALKNDATILPR